MFLPDEVGLEASLAQHSRSAWAGASGVESFSVPVNTVDRYVAEASLSAVQFLKIDVEGAELLVLKGAKELLTRDRPMLLLEIWSEWSKDFGYTPLDLVQFLRQFAPYELFHCGHTKLTRTEIQAGVEPGHFPRFINFLGMVPEVHGPALDSLRRAGLLVSNSWR